MPNPFIEKALIRKEKMRKTIANHVRELEKIHEGVTEPETKARIAARLEEAREAARQVG